MKAAVVTFPGSNCDYDCFQAVAEGLGGEACYVWHREPRLPEWGSVVSMKLFFAGMPEKSQPAKASSGKARRSRRPARCGADDSTGVCGGARA